MKLVNTVLEVKSPQMPPKVEFIEDFIKSQKIDPIRWAIIEANENILKLSVSGKVI